MRRIYFNILSAGILIILAAPLKAQVHINLNVNISSQPIWGPTGFDYVEYYYLPDIEVYYYVPTHRYYYFQGGHWIGRSSLPSRFHNFDLYNSYKVVVNEKQPWKNHETYKAKYSSYKGRHDQQSIRDSRDSKYFVNKNHPEHNNWVRQQKHDNGKQNNGKKGNNGNGNDTNKANRHNNNRDKQEKGNDKK
jgi:hypothetical protein